MEQIDISWLELGLGSLLIIAPLIILCYFRTRLGRPLLWAFLRMAGQLTLVGLYLNYIFDYNELWLNLLWVVIMIIVAGMVIVKRSELSYRHFLLPVVGGVAVGVVFTSLVFVFLVIGPDSYFNARYIIPISGMMIGNCLNSAIIGVRTFYRSLVKEKERYMYYLMCGATRNEALFAFANEAFKAAFGPTVGSTATIGLIWLPGMMTGQILGGSDPLLAIKYQILIVAAIVAGSSVNVLTGLAISKRFVFDEMDMLRKSAVNMGK